MQVSCNLNLHDFFQLRHVLARNISACVFNPEGQPVSWVMQKIDSSDGMSHTIEKYRDLGIYSVALVNYFKKHYQSNTPSFGYTAMDNERALYVYKQKFGYVEGERVLMFQYTPPPAHL